MKSSSSIAKFITLATVFFASFSGFVYAKEAQPPTKQSEDICHLDPIYSKEFSYSLPRNILESFLFGKAFDKKENYTPEQLEIATKDINNIFQGIMAESPIHGNEAVLTAGGPGAGKTFLMRQELARRFANGEAIAYIDPDDVCLQNMVLTFLADVRKDGNLLDKAQRLQAYNEWRPASNAANHIILANLIKDKYSFYFGTTSSSPATGKFLEFLKEQGYKIRLLHLSAPDNVRWGSIQERDKTFVQTTENDIIEKGLLVPQRINDTYLRFADQIDFFYRNGVQENGILAAKWRRNPENSKFQGTLEIINPNRYEKIKEIHNAACKTLQRADLIWESSVESNSLIVIEDENIREVSQR